MLDKTGKSLEKSARHENRQIIQASKVIPGVFRVFYYMGFPDGSVVKNPPANAGDPGSAHWSGRSLGEGNGKPLQYSCLGNPMNRGA